MARSNPSNPVGRPSKITPEILDKLRSAFLIGATNAEACGYADIGERTLYDYLEKNPEFSQKIQIWKDTPILAAKQKVVNDIGKDVKNAQWYLERKRKDEFSQKVEQEHSGGVDPVKILLEKYGVTEAIENDRKDDETVSGSSKSTT